MATETERVLDGIFNSIFLERIRQDDRWGEQNHVPEVWLAILEEEVGEMSTAMLRLRFAGYPHRAVLELREEALHVAAVAIAFIECLDRGKANYWEPAREVKADGD